MAELSVNTTKMSNSAQGISDLADRAGAFLSNLHNRLMEAGPAWGADATGDAFFESYGGSRNHWMETMSGISSSLGDTHDRIVTMADGFTKTEEENAASINLGGDNTDGHGSHTPGA